MSTGTGIGGTGNAGGVPYPDIQQLLVPITVDALVVDGTQQHWADCATTASGSEPEWPAAFSELGGPRALGVYLHWTVPDALTATSANSSSGAVGTEALEFMTIPDRWAVLRIYTPPTAQGTRAVNGWVLCTDGASPTVTPLASFVEPGTSGAQPWDVTGPGDPSWCAYYDNVVNRLGFHDSLEDIIASAKADPGAYGSGNSSVSYLVCGWYANLIDDPCAPMPFGSDLAAWILNEYNWALTSSTVFATMDAATAGSGSGSGQAQAQALRRPAGTGVVAGGTVGSGGLGSGGTGTAGSPGGGGTGEFTPLVRTVMHGSAVNLTPPSWAYGFTNDDSGPVALVPSADRLSVFVGASLTEAMAASLAARGLSGADRILEGFQLGLLDRLDAPDGIPQLEAALHSQQFTSEPGGSYKPIIRYGTQSARVRRDRARSVTSQIPLYQLNPLGQLMAQYGSQLDGGGVPPILEFGNARSLPPFYRPSDPVVLIGGGGRSFKHGYDGRFNQDGTLTVRQGGDCITEIGGLYPGDNGGMRAWISAAQIQQTVLAGFEVGDQAPEAVQELLVECVALDPGSALELAQASAPASYSNISGLAANYVVEQTAWWTARTQGSDAAATIQSYIGVVGTLPSPLAVTPSQSWNPRHVEWEVQVEPSDRGMVDWLPLGETDFQPTTVDTANADAATLSGRALLTGGAATSIAAAAQSALEAITSAGGSGESSQTAEAAPSQISAELLGQLAGAASQGAGESAALQASQLAELVSALSTSDVIAGALDGFHAQLSVSAVQSGLAAAALRAGVLSVTRLRLVDCFGQFVDLLRTGVTSASSLGFSETMVLPGGSTASGGALPPRWFDGGRVWLRYVDADDDANTSPTKPAGLPAGFDDDTVSPVCGFLLPNHLNGSLDFYNADGSAAGRVITDPVAGTVWEASAGQPTDAPLTPSSELTDLNMCAIADALIDQGMAQHAAGDTAGNVDDALSAALRTIDSTRWAVDPFGEAGDDHLSLLLGHPVAVLRALLRIDFTEASATYPWPVPVHLGSLTHWQDGLLGYYLDSEPGVLHAVHPAATSLAKSIGPGQGLLGPIAQTATYAAQSTAAVVSGAGGVDQPVAHPTIDSSGVIWVTPQTDVWLTLLVEPYCSVHATTGILPQLRLDMKREWIASQLNALIPQFLTGPVIVDPTAVRLPVPTDISAKWSWMTLTDPTTWATANVTNATDSAALSGSPRQAVEGWLVGEPP